MTDLPDPGTDPTPSEGAYGFLGRIIGLPMLEQVILGRLDRLEQLIGTNEADKQALAEALTESRSTDVRVDAIEPEPFNHQAKRTHTGHRDGNPGASNKKGTKP